MAITEERIETELFWVEANCFICGKEMKVMMIAEQKESYEKYDGRIICHACHLERPEVSKKEKKMFAKYPNAYVLETFPPEKEIESPPKGYVSYLQSEWWKEQREKALERAQHKCQLCNSPHDLHVHHRTYDNIGCEQPEDLTTLCKSCHYWFHKSRHKFNTDFDVKAGDG